MLAFGVDVQETRLRRRSKDSVQRFAGLQVPIVGCPGQFAFAAAPERSARERKSHHRESLDSGTLQAQRDRRERLVPIGPAVPSHGSILDT